LNIKTTKSLSVFFPCYNDAGTIGSMVAAADAIASEFTDDYEIIVVDDGSTDSSRGLLEELNKKYSRLKLIFHKKNQGYGAALRSGFYNATKELIFYTDGDGQYDVMDLRSFLPIMRNDIDIVNGYKMMRNDPLHRILIGRIYVVIMRLLFGFHIRDVDCDFRLMRRSIFDIIQLKHNSGVICLELVKKLELAGYRFVEYPVCHYHRTYGVSQFFKVGRLTLTALNIIRLWWEIIVLKQSPRNVAYSDETIINTNNPSLSGKRRVGA
jgi:glycosyltransferase involved in cell wall biosynthesis